VNLSANTRTYIYGIAIALVPILVSFGLLTEDRAPLFVTLIAAVLASGPSVLAIRNVTPDTPDTPDDAPH
jgi:hypothetical protein